MPKRLTFVVLLFLAAAVGWFLLRPLPRPHHRTVAVQATQTPEASPSEQPTALETATETVESESPSPAETPSAAPAQTARPRQVGSPATGPKLALIIDDCGQWVDIERGFIALPIPITMSVLPHVHAGTTIAQEAQAAGKGVMLHLPMEPLSGINPGPGEIKTTMTDAQIDAQVEDDLAQVPLAAGVNNHEGSKGSADERVMHDVIGVIQKHGNLFFIDSRTNAASVAENVAAAAGVPTASRDVFLDNKEDVSYSEGQLREAIAIAKRTGSAIAIGHPRKTTLEAVTQMIPEFQADGVQLVLAQTLTH